MNHTSAWIDPMTEPFDKTAYSERRFKQLMRDYPRTTQIERADHLPLLWALLAGGVALAVMAVRRLFR